MALRGIKAIFVWSFVAGVLNGILMAIASHQKEWAARERGEPIDPNELLREDIREALRRVGFSAIDSLGQFAKIAPETIPEPLRTQLKPLFARARQAAQGK